MTSRHVPASFDELVQRWDHFIVTTIYRVSRGHVRPDDLPDLKQAVYLRVHQTDYLSRCRTLIAARGGSFSTYLFMLVRSVLVNTFDRNSRNPLNNAIGVVESGPGPVVNPDRRHKRQRPETTTTALILETHQALVDDRFEREFEAREWLDRFEQHLETARAPWVARLPDGRKEQRTLATIFRLWRQHKDNGNGWPKEIAAALGIGTGAVFTNMKKIRDEAVRFEAMRPAA